MNRFLGDQPLDAHLLRWIPIGICINTLESHDMVSQEGA